ncbi:glycine cleavage system protein GcvH [Micrococcales bacterium 31B]|nr:glycine cleavage system protein GcvH [Micrococcales bacterium 31B]
MSEIQIPADLGYSAEHEWAQETDNGAYRIGITAVATDALGDIVYVDLPEEGSQVTAGEVCGEVESTKSVSELYSPVTGTVVSLNQAAADDTGVINEDPYGAGWLFEVEVEGTPELLTAEEYAEQNGQSL